MSDNEWLTKYHISFYNYDEEELVFYYSYSAPFFKQGDEVYLKIYGKPQLSGRYRIQKAECDFEQREDRKASIYISYWVIKLEETE